MLLNSIPNGCIRDDYVHGFYFEAVKFKQDIKMFDRKERAENIYKGVVEPPYKTKNTRAESTRAGHRSKMREESELS